MDRKQMSNLGLLLALALAVSLGACTKPDDATSAPKKVVDNSGPLTKLVAKRASVDLSQSNPTADYWNEVVGGTVTLMGQPMINPKPETTTTEGVQVQAIHDGTRVAFRLRWKDPEVSEAGRLGEFSDAIALEFPQKTGTTPPVMMGAAGMPVLLYHWRAQYQHDEEHGKPKTQDLYPNASVDMYAHEFKTAPGSNPEAAEKYSPAKALGNPQAYPKRAVDVIIAEGFGSSAVQDNDGASGKGAWADGWWTVVITRPLTSPAGSTLAAGTPASIAFAAWQGGKGEVGSRKCVTMAWTELELQ